jgi:TPR repeat protein
MRAFASRYAGFHAVTEFEATLERAESGDPTAQGYLAHLLIKGEAVPRDNDAALHWLLKAVAGEDPWALTSYAMYLRSSSDAECVRLLEIAAKKGDARAHHALGDQLIAGIGTEKNLHRAAAELLMASFAGSTEAAADFAKLSPIFRPDDWPLIFNFVRWPILTVLMGPLAEGHLPDLTQNRLEDDGTDDAQWFQYERQTADNLFLTGPGKSSLLDMVFGDSVTVKSVYVGRAVITGERVAAVTINFGNVLLKSGHPPFHRPRNEDFDALLVAIAAIEFRKWLRWAYQSF